VRARPPGVVVAAGVSTHAHGALGPVSMPIFLKNITN
jgi:hypothetical protein